MDSSQQRPTDTSGTPIQSWRLTFWPELGVNHLYDSTVPWDPPKNAGLRSYDTHTAFFWYPSGDGRRTRMTDYVAVVGPRTAWPSGGGRKLSDITDDPASTILVLEVAGSGIHWMEPRDVTLDGLLASARRSNHGDHFNALFADFSVRRIRRDVDRGTLKALLTIDGGERIDPRSWQAR
jgi:hypothetical protein